MLAYIKKKYYLCSGFDNSHLINTIKTFGTIMVRTTFNRLRSVKDSLPHGSMDAIAAELEISGDEVRAYFNGDFEILTDLDGEPLGKIHAIGSNIWTADECRFDAVSGVNALYLRYKGTGNSSLLSIEFLHD